MDWECRPRIAELREDKQLTQLELAQQVGVTETTIANWERGRSGIEWIDRLIHLCAALECSPEDLLSYIPQRSEDDDSFSAMVRLTEDAQHVHPLSDNEVHQDISPEAIEQIAEKGGSFSQIVKLIDAGQQAQARRLPLRSVMAKGSTRTKRTRKTSPSA